MGNLFGAPKKKPQKRSLTGLLIDSDDEEANKASMTKAEEEFAKNIKQMQKDEEEGVKTGDSVRDFVAPLKDGKKMRSGSANSSANSSSTEDETAQEIHEESMGPRMQRAVRLVVPNHARIGDDASFDPMEALLDLQPASRYKALTVAVPHLTRYEASLVAHLAASSEAWVLVEVDAGKGGSFIVYASEAFVRLFRYPRRELLGKDSRMLQGERTDRVSKAQIRGAFIYQNACECTLINYRKDGSMFWNEHILHPLFGRVKRGDERKAKYWISINGEASRRKGSTSTARVYRGR